MTLSVHDIKKLEGYWININEYKTKLRHRERDLLESWSETDINIGGSRSGSISDKTGNDAVILANDIEYQNLKRIVYTVETMYKELDGYQKTIVDMKYFSKREAYEWKHIGEELNMSVQRVLRIRNNLIDETAKRIGWV